MLTIFLLTDIALIILLVIVVDSALFKLCAPKIALKVLRFTLKIKRLVLTAIYTYLILYTLQDNELQ
jgi:hypothetical protein